MPTHHSLPYCLPDRLPDRIPDPVPDRYSHTTIPLVTNAFVDALLREWIARKD